MLAPTLILLGFLSPSLQAEPPDMKVTLSRQAGAPGSAIRGKVTLVFGPGLHGYQNPPSQDYQIPVTVTVEGAAGSLFLNYPIGEAVAVGGESEPSFTYSGAVEIPFLVKAPSKPGKHEITVKVRYQQCTDSMCYPPKTISYPVAFTTTKKSVVFGTADWARALAGWK